MALPNSVNQLVFAIVAERQADELMRQLVKDHFYFTKIDSTALALQEPNVFLLIGLNKQRMDRLMGLVREACQPYKEYVPVRLLPPAGMPPLPMIEASAGGALLYSVEVQRFIQI